MKKNIITMLATLLVSASSQCMDTTTQSSALYSMEIDATGNTWYVINRPHQNTKIYLSQYRDGQKEAYVGFTVKQDLTYIQSIADDKVKEFLECAVNNLRKTMQNPR